MLIKNQRPPRPPVVGWVALVGVAAAILWLEGPDPTVQPAPAPVRAAPASTALPELRIEVAPTDWATIEAARERALAAGALTTDERDQVPAIVYCDGRGMPARIRLKGDWLDHIGGDKWSLRIELQQGTLFGMSRFSIQDPKTRGEVMEWLFMAAARREGLLAPRSTFVAVAVADRPTGIYYLEEHFTKQLLEAQGRRDGPIVRMLEDSLWSSWLQYSIHPDGERTLVPMEVGFATTPHAAEIGAYGEARLGKDRSLNQRLHRAVRLLREAQLRVLADDDGLAMQTTRPDRLLRLEAVTEVRDHNIDDLFVAEQLGRYLALCTAFDAAHGLSWNNMRFYHDPVVDRLEPIAFDVGAQLHPPDQQLAMMRLIAAPYLQSARCRETAFATLARLITPEWLASLHAEFGAQLASYAAALAAEGRAEPGLDEVAWQKLTSIADHARAILAPDDPINFTCSLVHAEDQLNVGTLVVEAWATTAIPVAVHGFRFGNDSWVPAARAIAPDRAALCRGDDSVVLPRAGRHVVLRLPMEERLARLHDVEAVRRALRGRVDDARAIDLRLDIEYRTLAGGERKREPVRIRRVATDFDPTAGRPEPPSLTEAIERSCLAFNTDYGLLSVPAGEWDVAGDLIVPRDRPLHLAAGTVLRFEPGAVFLCHAPVRFLGTAEQPVILESKSPDAPWAGLVVLDCSERSRLEHVVVRRASAVQRGGWQTTGGVTFYRSPVDIAHCRFEDARGEDALNVFGTDFTMVETVFDGGVSDLFDGDFVTGEIRECRFASAVGDGVDLSGSRVSVLETKFEAIEDKALSLGEASRVKVESCEAKAVGIGLACKDGSNAQVTGLRVDDVTHFGIAVFVKKPDYGPAKVTASGVEFSGETGTGTLVQTDCELELDGKTVPTRPVDVERMYESAAKR